MQLEERDPQGWALKALRETGNSLISELRGLDADTLRGRADGDEWSLAETAGHLRDAEALALDQISAIVEGHDGPLPFRDIDALAFDRDYRSDDATEALAEFRSLRSRTARVLWELSESEWQRTGEHPYRGPITIGEIARELAEHDLEHLWQVRRLKAELGAR